MNTAAASAPSDVLPSQIHWLIRMRWVAIIGVVIATIVATNYLHIVQTAAPLYGITGLMALFNGWIHLSFLRSRGAFDSRQAARSAYVQMIADPIFLTLLLHFSGSVENPFLLFFVFQVVIAAILLPPRVSFVVAGASILLFCGVVVS